MKKIILHFMELLANNAKSSDTRELFSKYLKEISDNSEVFTNNRDFYVKQLQKHMYD